MRQVAVLAPGAAPPSLTQRLFGPPAPGARRVVRILLFALLFGACALRVWLVFRFNPMDHVWSDPERHWILGSRPLDTQPMAAIDPIGYQVYLAVLAKLTVQSPVLVAFWTALLSLAGPWLWYRFLRELVPGRDWALAGWVLLALLPSWSAIYSYFMQETLMLPLLGAALWATWRARRKRTVASFVVATALWLAAGLTRGICLPLGFVALAWLWWQQEQKLAKALASLALVTLLAAPLAGRSWSIARVISPYGIGQMVVLYHRSGAQSMVIEFSRQGGREKWRYEMISPSAADRPFAPLSDWRWRREWTAHFAVDLDAGSRDWAAARDRLPPIDLGRLVWLTTENMVMLFFGSSWPDTDRERWIGAFNHGSRWIWVPLTVLCLGTSIARRRVERERLLPALIGTWIFVQGVFPLAVNEGRYRKPFEGLLVAQCLLVAAGCARSRQRERRPDGLRAGVAASDAAG
jgi:hypothetical protein